MPSPDRAGLLVIGAGPVGLEAALAAVDGGFDVRVVERATPGAHPRTWGHVRMFTPWRMNVGPRSAAHLRQVGWNMPDAEAYPSGAEFARDYLDALGELPELRGRLLRGQEIIGIGRAGTLKGDYLADPARAEHPFRLLARDACGVESILEAVSVIDATGVYATPNVAGDGGIPARGERRWASHITYRLPDVLGEDRVRYAGRTTLLVGAGTSAATTATALAHLAEEAPRTRVYWVTRKPARALFESVADDPLPARAALYAAAHRLVRGGSSALVHKEGCIDAIDRVEGRFEVTLSLAAGPREVEADEIVVHTGFGPDNALYRELQVHECYASRGPMGLAAALLGAGATDCLTTPAFGADVLANPEPNFFIIGHKSYGRSPHFLLETGFAQAEDVIAALSRRLSVRRDGVR
jgi:thioredoxin reductase